LTFTLIKEKKLIHEVSNTKERSDVLAEEKLTA